jgi:hypothetical protein
MPRAISSSSALYGSLGVVFAILAWLAIGARLVVYCSAFNVVRHEQRHGTVTVGIEVPRVGGEVPLVADRGGAVAEAAPPVDGADRSTTPGAGGTTAPVAEGADRPSRPAAADPGPPPGPLPGAGTTSREPA